MRKAASKDRATLYHAMSVRVRLAPSPTGPLHVGTARTALFNFLFARRSAGKFLLRIEDTDRERSKPAFEQEILDGLRWLGLAWDEGPDVGGSSGPYRQSERGGKYRAALDQLLGEGKAFEREGAIVLKAEPREIVVSDLVRGEVRFPAAQQEDFIIARSLDDPLFHLAVVVDDADMGITHVIRGEDHLSNTPRHILLQRALGLPIPQYAHLPLLLDAQRHKLSKRTAITGLREYRERGYLPEAMVNFLALLGWNPKSTQEVFTLDELVAQFDLAGVQKGGAVFDVKKLGWLQRQHVKALPLSTLASRAAPYLQRADVSVSGEQLERSLDVWRERGGTLAEIPEALRFYAADPPVNASEIPWRGQGPGEGKRALAFAANVLERLPDETWQDPGALQKALVQAVDEPKEDPASPPWLRGGNARGTVLWPLRYALSGRRESPGPGEIAWVLGKETTLQRIRRAMGVLEET